MKSFSLNIRGKLVDFDKPIVMGIINVTPDSFHDESRAFDYETVKKTTSRMLEQGVDIIDVGAYSTRPGCDDVSAEEEIARLSWSLPAVKSVSKDVIVSVDTFRSDVAEYCVRHCDVDMINDVSGGDMDPNMFDVVSRLKVPYVITDMAGTPQDMMDHTADYADVTIDVLQNLSKKVERLRLMGVNDVIVDPGFGFGKTLDQNYELMRNLDRFSMLDCPLLVGISRKSMITRLLNISSADSLPSTCALNLYSLMHGASILRVHDVKEAIEMVAFYQQLIH